MQTGLARASQTKIAKIPAKFDKMSSNFAGEYSKMEGFPTLGALRSGQYVISVPEIHQGSAAVVL